MCPPTVSSPPPLPAQYRRHGVRPLNGGRRLASVPHRRPPRRRQVTEPSATRRTRRRARRRRRPRDTTTTGHLGRRRAVTRATTASTWPRAGAAARRRSRVPRTARGRPTWPRRVTPAAAVVQRTVRQDIDDSSDAPAVHSDVWRPITVNSCNSVPSS